MGADQPLSREIMTDLYELTMAASYFEQENIPPNGLTLFAQVWILF